MRAGGVEEWTHPPSAHPAVGGVAAALGMGAVGLEVRQGRVATVVAHVAGAGARPRWADVGRGDRGAAAGRVEELALRDLADASLEGKLADGWCWGPGVVLSVHFRVIIALLPGEQIRPRPLHFHGVVFVALTMALPVAIALPVTGLVAHGVGLSVIAVVGVPLGPIRVGVI